MDFEVDKPVQAVTQTGSFDASVLQVLPASPQELAAHEAYLDGLDKAAGGSVWRRHHAMLQQATLR